ncbi:group II intron maturase-specific domain-containing protein [Streptomyces sp. NPDC002133]|uniref:group II intron maturase-specific domain-containing protein n=1 Tax=Streptomyces sp. NPDC002133 TaxID=3154409 RepID=UPI0033288B18
MGLRIAPVTAFGQSDAGAAGQGPSGNRDLEDRAAGVRCGRRPQPGPAGLAAYFRNGNSGRKFNAVDSYVHERLAIFTSRKHGQAGRNWVTRYTYGWITRLGVYRLIGNAHRAAAHGESRAPRPLACAAGDILRFLAQSAVPDAYMATGGRSRTEQRTVGAPESDSWAGPGRPRARVPDGSAARAAAGPSPCACPVLTGGAPGVHPALGGLGDHVPSGGEVDYSSAWCRRMSKPSTPAPSTCSALATGG